MKRLLFPVVFLCLLFSGVTYADSLASQLNIFTPSAIQNGTDLSIQYLGDMYGVVDGVLHGNGSQVMGQMFEVFNAGALLLGSIIVIYTLLISLLNTAHEGEMLGKKWNSIWIPLRTVLGIALLIPKATGYCAIQIFMMWVIVQGVGLADTVWNQVTNYLAAGGVIVQNQLATQGSIGDAAQDMLRQTVCLAGLQKLYNDAYTANIKSSPPAIPDFMAVLSSLPTSSSYCKSGTCTIPLPNFSSNQNTSAATWTNLNGVCGNISWKQNSNNASGSSTLEQAYEEAVRVGTQQILTDLSGPSQTIVYNLIYTPKNVAINFDLSSYVDKRILVNAASDYEGIVYPAQRGLQAGYQNAITQSWIKDAAKNGWIDAGAYYVSLSSQDATAGSATFTAPSGQGISSLLTTSDISKIGSVNPTLNPYASQHIKKLSHQITDSSSTLNSFISKLQTSESSSSSSAAQGISGALNVGGLIAKALNPLLNPLVNIITSFVNLATSQSTNVNPVTSIAVMGAGLIGLVVEVWLIGAATFAGATAVLGVIPSVTESTTMGVLSDWIVPFLWGICGLLFIEGAVMAYYVPMIPFILFLFGAIGWLMATLEAMVAAPIVALGVTHPEGQEVLGKADPAVLLLVNVFLRPSMMIIGFIGGVILSYISVWLLNKGFFTAFLAGLGKTTLGSLSPVTALFGFPAMLVVYVGLVIALLNYCFALINVVPDKVMRWIGGQVEGVAGEAGKMAGEVKGGLEKAAQTGGDSAKSMAEKAGQRADKGDDAAGKLESSGDSSGKGKGGNGNGNGKGSGGSDNKGKSKDSSVNVGADSKAKKK